MFFVLSFLSAQVGLLVESGIVFTPPPARQVKLIPQDYDPSIMGAINDSLIDTSDAEGRYSFKNVIPGIYNVLAIQIKQRTRMLVTGLEVDSGTITASGNASGTRCNQMAASRQRGAQWLCYDSRN